MEIKNRCEIIFIYDVLRSNPNGDPDDGNRPRMDEQGYNIVSDVRLKRTIRDYWINQAQNDRRVLIKQQFKDDKKTVMSMRDIVAKELNITDISKTEIKYTRDLGGTLTMVIQAIQDLFNLNTEQNDRINEMNITIQELEQRINKLECST